MEFAIDDEALNILFRRARSQNKWTDRPVTDEELRAVYELAKLGPTSANGSPARFAFCRTPEAKERLGRYASSKNREKILVAPVTAIVAYDIQFHEQLPRLFPTPQSAAMVEMFRNNPALAEATAFRNSSLQGAYLMMAARALGLDCGPMSGFDNAKVDAEFFPGSAWKSNFICSLGHGDPDGTFPRLPRLEFAEACRLL